MPTYPTVPIGRRLDPYRGPAKIRRRNADLLELLRRVVPKGPADTRPPRAPSARPRVLDPILGEHYGARRQREDRR